MGNTIFVSSTPQKQNNYGCGSLLFDLFMIVITGGIWLIWMAIRHQIKKGL